jgi:titin
MKITPSPRRQRYLSEFVVFLIAVALIAGMVGFGKPTPFCDPAIASTARGLATTPGEGVFTDGEGTVVNVTAEADEGYHSVIWTGDVRTIANTQATTTTSTMNIDYSVMASFGEEPEYTSIVAAGSGVPCDSIIVEGNTLWAYDPCDEQWRSTTFTGEPVFLDYCHDGVVTVQNGDNVYAYIYDAVDHQWHSKLVSSVGFVTAMNCEGNILIEKPYTLYIYANAYDPLDHQWHEILVSTEGSVSNRCNNDGSYLIDEAYTREIREYAYDPVDRQWHVGIDSPKMWQMWHLDYGVTIIDRAYTRNVWGYVYDPTDHQYHSIQMSTSSIKDLYYCPGGRVIVERTAGQFYAYWYDANDHQWHQQTQSDATCPPASIPKAAFTSTPATGYAPLCVQFVNYSWGADSFFWNFGDGGWSFEENPVHKYADPGFYTVSLTVDGVGGSDSETIVSYVYVMGLAPLVTTNPATAITTDSATLNAHLDDLGTASSVDVSFQLATDAYYTSSGGSYDYETGTASMTGPGNFWADLSGLTPGTMYHFRAKAVGHGTAYGGDMTFTASSEPPSVTTNPATDITTDSATLNAHLNDVGTASSVDVSFQLATDAYYISSGGNYDYETGTASMAGSGNFWANLSGLTLGTMYHFRAKAAGHGTVYGSDMTFATSPAAPSIFSVSPNEGTQGQTLDVIITGTCFTGATSVDFGSGITVNSFVVGSPTQITTNISIDPAATPWARDVSITTPGGTAAKTGGFTVNAAPPTISTVSPGSGVQGQTLSVTITGTYFTGATSASFGSEITVNSFNVDNSTQITANITISGSAATGSRDVSLTTPGGTATKTGGFAVNQAPPAISTLSPGSGIQGQTLNVIITGTYFSGATSVSFGSGITVNSFNVDSSTQITANISISGSATLGARDVSVATPGGTAAKTGGFTVTVAAPTISTVSPNSGVQGQTLNVTITGTYFTGAITVSFGSGITVNSFTVDSATQITANITIDAAATPGTRDVSVTTPQGTATKTGGFTVNLPPPSIPPNTWTNIGPYGGTISSLAVSPDYAADLTLYAGSGGGRVYKTMDGGANWMIASTGTNAAGSVLALAVSPNYSTDNTVFAGVNCNGIYRTTDGGSSWNHVETSLDPRSFAISPNYTTDETIFAGSHAGVYKSTDGGSTWIAVNSGISDTYYACYLAISPDYASDQTVYVAGAYGQGVYKSTDGGASWTAVSSGISNLYMSSLAISPNYSTDHTVFAGSNQGGVYKTTNGGASWSTVTSGIIGVSLAISPNYSTDHTVFARSSDKGVYKTTDGGANWNAANSGVSDLSTHSLAVSPNYETDQTVYIGTLKYGVYKTTDGGANWNVVNIGISSAAIGSVAISPNYSTDNTVFAGSIQGGVYKTTDGGASWMLSNSGMSGLGISALAISPIYVVDHTVFAGAWEGGVYKTTDGGASWISVNTGLTGSISHLAISPNFATDHTVFAGGCFSGSVYKTTDGAASWTLAFTAPGLFCLAISPDYATDRTVYAGTDSGIYKTIDGGQNWTTVNSGIPNLSIYAVAISPNFSSDQTVYAGGDGDRVYKTTDGGVSWLTTPSIHYTIHSIAVSPNYASDKTVLVGTGAANLHGGTPSNGVYKSTNSGASWTTMNSGLPTILNEVAPTIAISPNYAADRTVFAGTKFYSVYSYTGASTINTVSAASGLQGQSFSVTITGTYFTGATTVSFGSGITVNSFTVDSSTQITANITISGSATTGSRDVSVTTPGGMATKTGGFTVNQAPPTITTVSPNSDVQGQTLDVIITGTYLTDASSVSFGSGITVNSFNVDNSTQITSNISISGSAATGARDVSVTTPGGTVTKTGGFTVNQAPPTITTLSPNSDVQGQTLDVIITGTYLSGATSVSFGSEITVNSFNVDNSTQVTVNITISGSAATGARDVWVTTPGGTATKTGSFTVNAAPPTISTVSPDSDVQGQTLNVTITGTYFTGATSVSFGSGITVNNFTVDNSTQITANMTISGSAATGARDVSVTALGGTATKTGGFTVNTAPPTITAVSPDSDVQGQSLNVTITGTYFTDTTSVTFGSGITVNGFNVDSSTQITANISISHSAATGARDVWVTTPGGTATKTGSFTVNAAPPTISTVSPDSDVQGQTLNVTITGTYFTGATSVSFGSGITVNNFTVDNSTQITANMTISGSAATGARDVSVTALGGTATKTGGFTVNTAPPTITAVSPDSDVQGQSLNVTITGTYFTDTSSVSFGSGITVNGFNVDSSAQITANITISHSAATGARDVSATTPGGTATKTGGFTISAPPDNIPPSTPTNLTSTAISYSRIDLSWNASTDNIGVVGYKIFNAETGSQIAASIDTFYSHTGLSPNTTYRYYVKAYDAAGNVSGASNTASATTESIPTDVWISNGPYGGHVYSSAISPDYANDGTIFAGTSGPGIYKSTNGGQSWTRSGLTDTDVSSLAISPNYATDTTVFAGTSSDIYKSTDGGQSWTHSGLTGTGVPSLAISPNYAIDATVFAGTYDAGIYKSTDGGQSWTCSGLTGTDVPSLAISPNYAIDATVFAGTYDAGIYKSTDGGQSWTQMNSGLATANKSISSLAISPNYATDSTIFAGVNDPYYSSTNGMYKSTDEGQSWTQSGQYMHVYSLAVSPNYASDATIFVGTMVLGVYKSTDGGQNWTYSGLTGTDVYSLAVSPNYASDATVFAGTYGAYGLYRSTNRGQSWSQMNNGLTNSIVSSLATSPNYANDATVFAGTSLGVYKSTNGGQSWTQMNIGVTTTISGASTLVISPNYVSDSTIFSGPFGIGAYAGVYKSTNGGQSWTYSGFQYMYVRSLAISPNYTNDATVFAGFDTGVYKSTNAGQNWSQMNSGLTNTQVGSFSISPNYANDSTIFVATSGGVFKSTNGGQSWSQSGLGYSHVFSLAISPNYAINATIFAGVYASVYKSTNGGQSWSQMNSGLTYVDVKSLAISPNYTNDATILAGTDGDGIYRSTNGGQSWSQMNGGLTVMDVLSVASSPYYTADKTIFAGTYKGGAFSYTFGDATPPITTVLTSPIAPDGTGGWFKTTPSITLTGDEPGTTYYSWTSSIGPWTTYSAPFSAPSGENTLYYYSVDTAGNVEAVNGQILRVDTAAPFSTIAAPTEGVRLNGITYTIQGTASDPSSSGVERVEVSINGGAWQLVTGKTSWSYDWTLPLDGSYNIKSRANDNAGNVETPGAGVNITVDNIAPTVTSTSPTQGATNVSISTNITAAFSEDMDSSTITTTTFTLSNGGPVSGLVSYNASTMTATFDPTSSLAYSTNYTATITAGVKDLVGNTLTSNKVWSFTTEAPPPTITTVSPNSGIQGQSLNVTITGTYLTGATAVSFGSGITVNSFNVDNSTQITANISISGSATTGARDVSVTTPGGTATKTGGFTVNQAPVTFPDPNLEAAIREAIGKPTGDIYRSDLLGLTLLNASSRGITDLTGLEYCTSLTHLNLFNNQISDLSPLSGLTSLRIVYLGYNQISDISPVSGLTSLTNLDLYNNQINDITPLSAFTSLTSLHIESNQIDDISPLSGLTSLNHLWLQENQISSISALAGLTSLRYLHLYTNQISDVSPLASLTSLTELRLQGNQIVDISALSGLTYLTRLELQSNQINDISPLSGLTGLTGLDLSSNQISNITPLSDLTSLTGLGLSSNQMSDIGPLSGLTSLTGLHLSYNQISDITPLSGLISLIELRLQTNQISDISALAGLINIRELYLNYNQISDIESLEGLTSLTWLYLDHNQISDVWPLVNNPGLSIGDDVDLGSNPLNTKSVNVYIPELEGRGVTVSWDTANHLPNQPSNVSPANGATGISLTPTLKSSAFSDPDVGDTHAASQWQTTTTPGDYSSPIFDSGADAANLESIAIPSGTLSESTTYYWRARHQDNRGDWSSWSVETSFTTIQAAPTITSITPNEGDQAETLDVTITGTDFPTSWSSNPTENTPICMALQDQDPLGIVDDGSGGAIIPWNDLRNGNWDIYAQRVDSSGTALWAADGIAICTATGTQYGGQSINYQGGAVTDGSGGAIIVWVDERSGNSEVYAQRVSSSGMVLWTTDGILISAASGQVGHNPSIASDDLGGAIIAWEDAGDIYAQRVDPSGTTLWTTDGVAICTASSNQLRPVIVNDGSGGAIMSWGDSRGPHWDVYAQRVDSSGTPQWTADGIPICTASESQLYTSIVSDNLGGAIISWWDERGGNADIYAQRVNSSGVALWTLNGVPICTASGDQDGLEIVGDGSGGAIITWHDERSVSDNIYAQRVGSSGITMWATDGVGMSTLTSYRGNPAIVSDGAGGAIIAWGLDNDDIYAQRVDSSGAALWTTDGVAISTAPGAQHTPYVLSDGLGGAVMAWRDSRHFYSGTTREDVYGEKVNANGSLGDTGAEAIVITFGPGITVSSFTVNSATQITASITISGSATTGTRDVSVTTPGGMATKTGAFTVNQAPPPTISTVSPNSGVQGQTLSVTITGTYLTGATSVSFGSGITVNSFTVDSSTQITASITISGSATTGARDVSVTTPGGTATKTGGFTVNPAPPTTAMVSPNSGIQGQTLDVTISGTCLTGTTSVSFGSGITVNSFTVETSTQTTANVTISGSATTGARDVSVTTPGGTATKTGGFTVNPAPPTIGMVSPNSGIQGQTLGVTITGTYLTGATSVSFGSGITVNSFNVDGSTQITANITISGSAATGARDVSVTTPGGMATKIGGFTVNPAPPTITTVSPNSGVQGQSLSSVTITGTYLTGATLVSFGSGITVNSFMVDSSTQITANISIPGSAATGARDVSVTTPGGTATKTGGFTVNAAPPTITTVSPNSSLQGQTATSVIITGTYFTNASVVTFGAGITVNSFTVNSATQITANITISGSATTGARDVSVTTPGGTATKTGGFTVNPAPPTITTVSPNSGVQGQSLSVTITGTCFTGATGVSFGSGITVNSFMVDSSTQIAANISISGSAATGARDVSVTTPGGTATKTGGFTVNPVPPPPAAPTLKSPASGSTVSTLTPRLEWNASTGAADYGLQVATSSAFTTLVVNVTGASDLFYDIAPGTLNWNAVYFWRVNARNSYGGTSVWSGMRFFRTAVGPPPNAPSNLIATPISSSQIDLTWQDNSSDETGFMIERKTGADSYAQIATAGAGVTSYSNTALTTNTTYYYRVRAYNAAGNSGYSNEASATTLPPPPAAPTLKSPASGATVSNLTPRLEWNASSGATSYGLQVATSSAFTTLLVNVTGITDLFYDVLPGILNWNTTYYWRVNASNSYGTSNWVSYWYFKTAVGPPPNTPSNLIATPISSSQINLTWQDNSSDETGFKIERKTGAGSYAQIATVGAGVQSYNNTGLSANTTYYYRVRAYNAAGDSGYTNEASATTLPPPPAAPTLKSPASGSTVSTRTPRLEWNASSGATNYGLQVATTVTFATLVVNQTGITDLYYDIAPGTLNWNAIYYWRVNASNSYGTSSWSSYRYFKTALGPPPNAPSDLTATTISSSQINLTWQDNSSDETGFKIERKTGAGSYAQIATVGAGVTSYSNTALTAGTTYYYRVRAYNAAGNSDYSNEASPTTLPPPPAAPTLKSPVSAATVSTRTPRLEWNASSGATDYGLQVATTSTFTTLVVNATGIMGLFYDILPGTLNWNTTYYWRVNARNSYGTSAWASYWYFKTAVGPPPNAPSDLIATPISSSQINLTWQDNSSDETGFKIERKTGAGSYAQIATVGVGVQSYNNTGLSANTTYYYRVRAYNAAGNSGYSNEASAATLPPPPAAPVLKSPASGATVSTRTPRLEWNASTGATSYGLQVATTSTFTTLLVNVTGITGLYYDIAPGTLNWNTYYYWRVNASNSYGSTSSWSGLRFFRTPPGP